MVAWFRLTINSISNVIHVPALFLSLGDGLQTLNCNPCVDMFY